MPDIAEAPLALPDAYAGGGERAPHYRQRPIAPRRAPSPHCIDSTGVVCCREFIFTWADPYVCSRNWRKEQAFVSKGPGFATTCTLVKMDTTQASAHARLRRPIPLAHLPTSRARKGKAWVLLVTAARLEVWRPLHSCALTPFGYSSCVWSVMRRVLTRPWGCT